MANIVYQKIRISNSKNFSEFESANKLIIDIIEKIPHNNVSIEANNQDDLIINFRSNWDTPDNQIRKILNLSNEYDVLYLAVEENLNFATKIKKKPFKEHYKQKDMIKEAELLLFLIRD